MSANLEDDELTAAIQAVRDRVRARHPENGLGLEGVAAADLTASASRARCCRSESRRHRHRKSAAARPQELHRAVVQKENRPRIGLACARTGGIQSRLHALRAGLSRSAGGNQSRAGRARRPSSRPRSRVGAIRNEEMPALHREAQEMQDIRTHWAEWRVGFEDRRAASEIHILRTISELQGAFQHRVTLQDQNFRETDASSSIANFPTPSIGPWLDDSKAHVGRPRRGPLPIRKTHSQRVESHAPENGGNRHSRFRNACHRNPH